LPKNGEIFVAVTKSNSYKGLIYPCRTKLYKYHKMHIVIIKNNALYAIFNVDINSVLSEIIS
jgi:hypothetical protein